MSHRCHVLARVDGGQHDNHQCGPVQRRSSKRPECNFGILLFAKLVHESVHQNDWFGDLVGGGVGGGGGGVWRWWCVEVVVVVYGGGGGCVTLNSEIKQTCVQFVKYIGQLVLI